MEMMFVGGRSWDKKLTTEDGGNDDRIVHWHDWDREAAAFFLIPSYTLDYVNLG